MINTAEELINQLKLQPHPEEGGYFREIYRSAHMVQPESLSEEYKEQRCLCTSIYFLLMPGTYSRMHRLKSDEIYHHYAGGPLELLLLYPEGTGRKVILGKDIEKGEHPQFVVPAGTWQGSVPVSNEDYVLIGTTVSPGFEYQDYENGSKRKLKKNYPEYYMDIEKLCP